VFRKDDIVSQLPPSFFLARALASCLVVLPVTANAQSQPTTQVTTATSDAQAADTPTARPKPDPFDQAIAARTVADYARRNKDASAMLVAAKLLTEIPITSGPADPAPGEATFTPRGLLAEARDIAGSDAILLTQIRIMESQAPRGVATSAFGQGLVRSVQTMAPRGAYQFSVTAKGGEKLRIGAIGDVGTSLLMRLIDAKGKIVCLDDQNDYAPVCQLTPGTSTQYKVDLMNKSAATSRAVILSN
jgi:hypothetical protein